MSALAFVRVCNACVRAMRACMRATRACVRAMRACVQCVRACMCAMRACMYVCNACVYACMHAWARVRQAGRAILADDVRRAFGLAQSVCATLALALGALTALLARTLRVVAGLALFPARPTRAGADAVEEGEGPSQLGDCAPRAPLPLSRGGLLVL
jgi:hypothetical protein